MSVLAPSDARLTIRRERTPPTMTFVPPSLDQPLPCNVEAEKCVLGAVIIRPQVFFRLANLTVGHFFRADHATIYQSMALMTEEGIAIDLQTLSDHLARRGVLRDIGGPAFLSSLVDVVPDIANVEWYGAIIERMAKKRAGVLAGYKLAADSLDPETEPEEVATAAMASLSSVATREEQQARPLHEVLSDAYDRQRTLAAGNRSVALDCGWPTLNRLKIFYPTLILCTAERGTGKSALMTSWARSFAMNGHKNAIFSLESAPREIGLRYTSMETGIPHSYLRDWRPPVFTDSHHALVAECHRSAMDRGIFVGKGPYTLEGVITELRRLRAMHGIEAAFLDYIQLLGSTKRFERSELMFNYMAQELLRTAMELDVAICAFSQVNKEGGVAYADSMEKSARVRLHFERDGCNATMFVMKNNEERTEVGGFAAHFDEVTLRWAEGTHDQVGHGRSVERRLF